MNILGLICVLVLCGTTTARANDFQNFPHSQGRFIATHDALSVAEPTYLALHLRLDQDWHTYWQNPGDSGAAPILKINAPAGVLVSDTLYPMPERHARPPLITFGYEHEVMYLFEAKLAESFDANRQHSIPITLEAEWLVCKVECIPAFGEFTLTLQAPIATRRPMAHLDAIAHYRTLLPRITRELGLEGSAKTTENGKISLSLNSHETLAGADFLPADGRSLSLDQISFQPQSSPPSILLTPIPGATPTHLNGLLIVTRADGTRASSLLELPITAAEASAPPSSPAIASPWKILGFAFLGGLLLNLMPCVFPIISIKLFAILKHAHGQTRTVRIHSLAYTLGVVSSFLAIAIALVVLRAGGTSLGWGFQMQSPGFLAALSFVFTAMAFSFWGLFEFNIPVGARGAQWLRKDGAFGQFLTGVLSTIVASPCTAPFMGFAMGAAISQSAGIILATFAMIGIGLSAPYLAFMITPAVLRILPKPGAWMEAVRQFMAFPLLATTLWLLWIMGQVASPDAIIATLGGLLGLGFAAWMYQRWHRLWPALAVALLATVLSFNIILSQPEASPSSAQAALTNSGPTWQAFTPEVLTSSRATNQPVFVDFTADWCITCKVNEKVTFTAQSVQDLIRDRKIIMIKADWTRRDAHITTLLSQYGRVGVPLYLLFKPGAQKAHILPEVLTPAIFAQEIQAHLE